MRIPRLYSWLVRLYPATFRERHGSAMEQQFRDEYREALTVRARTLVWARALADLGTSLPSQLARELLQDLRYTIRVYGRQPLTALLAITALGLAIGASTGVFSVLNALLLRSLPFHAPEDLVELHSPPISPLAGRSAFRAWSRRSAYLTDAAVFAAGEQNLTAHGATVRVRTAETTANFFSLLGTSPVVGRHFSLEEDAPGQTAVAVISHALWQQRFGGDPRICGTSLALDGVSFTIVGIAPPRFDFPSQTAVWVPTAFDYELIPKRGSMFYDILGRLRVGLGLSSARALFQAEIQQAAPAPPRNAPANRARLVSLRDQLAGPVGQASWVLAALILLLLLAACANVAHLLLSRLATRRQEFAVRTSLGASHSRLVQQLITEATALTTAGALLGLLVAFWASRLAASVVPPQLTTQHYTILDARVIGFALLLALLTGLVFGVLPSYLLRERPPELVRSSATARDRTTRRLRIILIAVQTGLTLVLLTSSFTMGRAFLHLLNTELGFRPTHTVTFNVSLQGTRHRTPAAEWRYYSAALERLRSTPGVEAAGAVTYVPLTDQMYMGGAFKLDSSQTVKLALMNAVTPHYFEAIGTKFVAGQDLPAALNRAQRQVIVNQEFAQAAGLGPRILGRRIVAPWDQKQLYTITGIVETSRFAGPESTAAPMVYWPIEEEPPPHLTFVVRVKGDAEASLAACRDAVRSVDPNVPLYGVETLEQRLAKVLARPRFFVTATLAFTTIACWLALAGIFGCTCHAVTQRSHEFGVRLALGATPSRLRTTLLLETLLPTLAGVAIGIALAFIQGKYLTHLLIPIQGIDPATCVLAAALLVLTATLSSWRATARLFTIDPVAAVRSE